MRVIRFAKRVFSVVMIISIFAVCLLLVSCSSKPPKPAEGDDWLFTDGNKIVDDNGAEVWITGLNWFGFNTERVILDGVWSISIAETVEACADHGFNLIRVPLSVELVNKWMNNEYPSFTTVNKNNNPVFDELGTLAYLDFFVDICRDNGVKVMLDMHQVRWKLGGHAWATWSDEGLTLETFYKSWEFLAQRYKGNDTVIAFDLRNEPHGSTDETPHAVWNDSRDDNENWKYAAEVCAARILAINPDVLILVEGIEAYPKDVTNNADYHSENRGDYYYDWWGGNLRGVKDFPVDLGKYQNKLVYSPHDYGASVSDQPWLKAGFTFESVYNDCWKDNWMYIHEQNIAPLLIGEWGGKMSEPNLAWMTACRQLIVDNKISHTFWCLNPNSGDTGGLLENDFKTWDTAKYEFLKPALWQKNGKFIGLDAKVPLGKNGLTRKQGTK